MGVIIKWMLKCHPKLSVAKNFCWWYHSKNEKEFWVVWGKGNTLHKQLQIQLGSESPQNKHVFILLITPSRRRSKQENIIKTSMNDPMVNSMKISRSVSYTTVCTWSIPLSWRRYSSLYYYYFFFILFFFIFFIYLFIIIISVISVISFIIVILLYSSPLLKQSPKIMSWGFCSIGENTSLTLLWEDKCDGYEFLKQESETLNTAEE